jgi:Endonuclease/Exonuclease/phosphatase family
MTEKLSIAWWNTSLSPSAKLRACDKQRITPGATDEERQIAIQVILHLLLVEQVDFLVLGEIANEDISAFQQDPNLDDYTIESGISKTGHIAFDTCFIYHPDKIAIDNRCDIDTGKSGKKLKIAQKLILQVAITQQPFYLFVSHWASRLWCQENDADRHLLGMRLRDDVDNILSNNSELIILLGDYNDEPFDDSLARQLGATRDKALVKRKPNLLYNPFWQHLTYPDADLNYAGTYYHKNGKETKWRTFDQIIVSSAFINTELQLNEAETGIVHILNYLKQVKDDKTIFDHLPIKTTIEKV